MAESEDGACGNRMHAYVLEHLDEAFDERWIQPHYQPVVRAATGEVCGEEALVRWADPTLGELLPHQFLSTLEGAGLSYKLDLYMMDRVLEDLLSRQAQGVPLVPVSVNVSPCAFDKVSVADELLRRVDAAGVERRLLRVEITETVASDGMRRARGQMRALHEAGFEVWLDDFGDRSSLGLLHQFDFDLIKLDLGLVSGSDVGKSEAMLRGVVRLARELGKRVLAEGVETLEQARCLESMGCEMLQGFYFARPMPLDAVIQGWSCGRLQYERLSEQGYWNAVSGVDLSEVFGTEQTKAIGDVQMSDFPAAVLERRHDAWRLVRSNGSYESFLERLGWLRETNATLRVSEFRYAAEAGFEQAASQSLESGSWERIAGRMEHGAGFQFFVRPVATTSQAEAFLVAAVPTMLGAALGIYGDVPIAYAVFRVITDEGRTKVRDAEYAFANDMYCSWLHTSQASLAGKSFLEVTRDASERWFPYCYRAAVLGEQVHDVMYSTEIGHWLSFTIRPTRVQGYCAIALALADAEREERQELQADLDTSDLIIRIVDQLSGETDYDRAMNKLLNELATVVHPDRLYIYERGETTTSGVFEWCAEGVASQMAVVQNMPNENMDSSDARYEDDDMILIPDVEQMRESDPELYHKFSAQGMRNMLSIPLRSDGRIVGYLGADNYALGEYLDTRRLIKTVAPFISTRMVNRRLMEELRFAGMYDALTGVLNRRGIDAQVEAYVQEDVGSPYALVLIDVDDFKTINDAYGHEVGDEALRYLATVIREAFPKDAVVGRNGGDEFLAMLPGDVAACADELVEALSRRRLHFESGGEDYRLSLSIGYVSSPDQAHSLREAYSMADAALYDVKLAGKDGCRRYHQTMEMQRRSQLEFSSRDIAENIPGAIVVHEPGDGRILFANDELIRLFECDDLDDLLAYTQGTFGNIVHPDDRVRVHDELALQMTLDDVGRKDYVDFRILTKRGNVRHVADNGRLVDMAGKGPVFYELIVNRDERLHPRA